MISSSQNISPFFETFIQRGVLDNIKRKVFVNEEYIEFEDKNRVGAENVRLYWKDFAAIRYGYEWIRGYYFYIGLRRMIFIRDSYNNEIKISLTSFYNLRNKRNQEKFSEILGAIFKFFLTNHIAGLIKLIKHGQIISLSGIQISKEDITFNHKKELIRIDFLVLNIAAYKRYFYIYSEIDKERGIRINFLEDWNSMLLYSVIKNILKNKVS
jgi:hypothetical protein